MRYFDKNGTEIKKGMFIKHDDGEIEEVFASEDEKDLGINADNENYVGFNPLRRHIYPLHQFNMKEWVIIEHK